MSPTPIQSLVNDLTKTHLGQNVHDAVVDLPTAGPNMTPAMARAKTYNAEEAYQELNRVPLFMTTLDESDGEGGANADLEALRALAYEGTRAEIAGNFREQGNDCARAKRWVDAKEFYTKALATLKAVGETGSMELAELDEVEESRKERIIEEASYVNRALANLELKNYRSCNADCAATLILNPSNIKAWFRSSTACLALGKLAEAEDACLRGLEIDESNIALQTLAKKITARKSYLTELDKARREREEKEARQENVLKEAIQKRRIPSRVTLEPPDMEDAVIRLADPSDSASILSVPVLLLYPLASQTDLIKKFDEDQCLLDHLDYILPVPWDEAKEYNQAEVDCFMPTPTGGLIKAGKKLPLRKLLESGKVELVDRMLQVYVVPRAKADGWVTNWRKINATGQS